MFTDKDTLLEIYNTALYKATQHWSDEQRKQLSEEAFKEVVTRVFKSKIEYPTMNPTYVKQ